MDHTFTGCKMKVQSPKVDVNSRATNIDDAAASAQVNVPADFFAQLISSMLTAPGIQAGTEEKPQTDDDITDQPQETDLNKLSFDSILSGINPLLEQFNQQYPAFNNQPVINASDIKNEETELLANLNQQTKKTMLSNYNNQAINIAKPSIQPDPLSMAIQDLEDDSGKVEEATIKQDINYIQLALDHMQQAGTTSKDNGLQQMPDDKDPPATPQPVLAPDAVIRDKPLNFQGNKKEQIQLNNSHQQPPYIKDQGINQLTAEIPPAASQVSHQSAEAMTVYSVQNGKVNYLDNQKNKYIDALVQMGDMINAQTTRTINNEQPAGMTGNTSPVNYADIFNKVNNHEYDLKIDLLPQSLDALIKESYNASIKIYPPELGAVLAKLKLEKNNAELVIMTEHTRVKEIIESNLTQLRENFQNADINLTNIQIGVQTSQAGADGQSNQNNHSANETIEKNDNSMNDLNKKTVATKTAPQRLNSLIDTYA